MRLVMRLTLILALLLTVVAPLVAQEKPSSNATSKEVAVTFDDLPLNGPDIDLQRLRAMTVKLLSVIKAHHVPVVAFVNERKL